MNSQHHCGNAGILCIESVDPKKTLENVHHGRLAGIPAKGFQPSPFWTPLIVGHSLVRLLSPCLVFLASILAAAALFAQRGEGVSNPVEIQIIKKQEHSVPI